METPAPVNVNLLKNILAKSKAVMAAVEDKSPTKKASRQRVDEDYEDNSYRNQPVYDERDEREPEYKTPSLRDYQPNASTQPKMYTAEQVMASNLPQAVKEAMIKNPIPQLQGPPSKFTLEDMSDLVEKPVAKPRKQLNEDSKPSNDMITISKTELKAMINEAIGQFFTQAYNKNLTEAAIKKTISTLINEGKLNVKKK
jgi:hypothetical protein